MSTKAAATIFVAVLTSLSALSGCAGDEPTQVDADTERSTGEPVSAQERGTAARAGEGRVEGEGRARANDRERVAGRRGESHSQVITLEIGGDSGTNFSGRCFVGGEEETIGGRGPARYVYEQGGGKLECEIRKRGVGALEVVLAVGNNVRSVQRTSAPGGTISFAYSGNSISSSTFDSSS